MKKILFGLFVSITVSVNGQFYFELNDSGIFSGNTSDEDPNPTAIVSEEEFNQYQIGDKYCRE